MLVNTLTGKMMVVDKVLIINKRDYFTPQYWSRLEYWYCMKRYNFEENCHKMGALTLFFTLLARVFASWSTQIVKNWTFRASWTKLRSNKILAFFRQVKALITIQFVNSDNFTVIYFCKTRTKLQEILVFHFRQKLTFSVQIPMSSGQFMVKTWHFQGNSLHFKFDFWRKSVKLLRWPKNEHSYIPILLTILDQTSYRWTKVWSIGLVQLVFLYISVYLSISIILLDQI